MATKRTYSAFQRAWIVALCSSPFVSKEAVADGTLDRAVFGGITPVKTGSLTVDLIPHPLSGGKSPGDGSPGVSGGESLNEAGSKGECETSMLKNGEGGRGRLLGSEKDDCLGAAGGVLPWDRGD